MKLSEKLQKIRKENNITQEGLADKLNVSRQAVSKWESGMAYPDTEKLIQISKIFKVSLDELINDNVDKNDGNNFKKLSFMEIVNNMLEFISKSVNMFWAMKITEKIKCLFEMGLLILIIIILALVSSSIIIELIRRIFSFIPNESVYTICSLFETLLFLAWFVLGILIIIKIFKTRYLDYYVFVTDDSVSEKKIEEPIKELKERKEYKVVIRDPSDSSINIVNKIGKVFTFLAKCFCFLILMPVVILFVISIVVFVYSLFYIFKGLFFNSISISILGVILFIYLVIEFIYNLLFNRKHMVNRIFIMFILSMCLVGIGLGLSFVSLSSLDYYENSINDTNIHTIEMSDNLVLDFMRYGMDDVIVDDTIDNIKIEIISYGNIDTYLYNYNSYNNKNDIFSVYDINYDYNDLEYYKDIIDDFINKRIVNYDRYYDVKIYVSSENLTILRENINKFNGYIVFE